jgi:hypothetical protein
MTMKKAVIFIFLSILTICLAAQDPKIDRVYYSLSWTPIYYGPNDGEFRLDAILPVNFEANVFYNLNNSISISSGIGFQDTRISNLSWGTSSIYDPTKSEKWESTTLRVPIQLNYKLSKNDKLITPYLKAEFVNEFEFLKARQYQDDILVNSNSVQVYANGINFGIGTFLNISKSIILLTEGSLGTHLYNYSFDGYQIKLKIGLMIK